ncbi:MAG: 16S rRNA (guanine(527)-N(7))-methyltransferase RsmG [Flavobacteriia bacterium]|nr:16S rRNA (guanine(527)-N(7))-methyltransferase RsmG [Flavobacteriia bacterium]
MNLNVEDGLRAYGLTPQNAEAMNYFLNELLRWNWTHNLTAITEPDAAIDLHLVDSIVIFPILKRYLAKPSQNKMEPVRIADLGSGGGLPAIPLAILEPDWSFTLIEASKKKAAFLQHVRGGLGLKNVHVVSERVENISSLQTYSFDAVTARAFTRLNRLLDLSTNLLKSTGLVFAMKSQRSEEEMSEVKNQDWKLLEECPLTLPNQKLDRRLLIFKH